MKYIQSFYRYVMTFSSIGKSFPARDAEGPMRNVIEITDDEYKTLMRREPMFRALVDNRKYRVLDYLPESAKPEAARINEAKAEAKKVQAENASLADENAALKAELEALKTAHAEHGKKYERVAEDAGVMAHIEEEKAEKAPAKKKTTSKI